MQKLFKPKSLFSVTALLFTAVVCKAQFTINSYSITPQLLGNVDSVVATEFILSPAIGKYKAGKDSLFKHTYVYEDNRLIEQYEYSYLSYPHTGKNTKPIKWVYNHDIVGNLTGYTRFIFTGQPYVKESDLVIGSHVKVTTTDLSDNRLVETIEYTLNSSSKVVERKTFMNTGKLLYTSYYKYDEQNLQIEEKCDQGDEALMYIRTCKYDEKGNLIEDNNRFGDRREHRFVYSNFDDHGNWLTRIEYLNKFPQDPQQLYERIIYYRKDNSGH